MAKNSKTLSHTKFRQDMDPGKRAELLGEEIGSGKALDTKIQNISDDIKQKIMGVKKFIKGNQQDMQFGLDLPFKEDPEKQKRYSEFVNEKEHKGQGATYTGEVSLDKIRNERQEFERFYKLYKDIPKKNNLVEKTETQDELLRKIDELQRKIQGEKAKRRVEQWMPDGLLCKRFNVPAPYKNRDAPIVEHKKDKFYDEILPAFFSKNQDKMPIRPEAAGNKQINMQAIQFTSNKFTSGGKEKLGEPAERVMNVEKTEEKPPFELFKSIFGDEEE